MADSTVNVYIIGHDKLSGVAGKAGSSITSLSNKLNTLGNRMTIGVTLPIVAGFTAAFREAEEAAKVMAQTEAVIKSTGGAANVTAKEVQGLADSLSKKTAIDDEQIQSSENLLLTFKGIRNEVGQGNDIFNQATEAVLDMSVALGQDGKSSAIQLGKALNDPIVGLTALRRVGVAFTEQQKEQIATLTESGDLLGAQKIILKEVMQEFSGSAEAAKTPFDELRQKMRDIAEQVGTKLVPILTRFGDVIIGIADAFLAMPDWAQSFVLGGAAVAAATGPFLKFAGAIATLVSHIPTAVSGVSRLATVIPALGPIGVGIGIAAIVGGIIEMGEGSVVTAANVDKVSASILRLGTVAALAAFDKAANQFTVFGEKAGTAQFRAEILFRKMATEAPEAALKVIEGMQAAGRNTDQFSAILMRQVQQTAHSTAESERLRAKLQELAGTHANPTVTVHSDWSQLSAAEQALIRLRALASAPIEQKIVVSGLEQFAAAAGIMERAGG